MSHLDEETLAAIAIGDGTPEERAHAAQCPQCGAEVQAFIALTARLTAVDPTAVDETALESPPVSVWSAIRSEAAVGDASASTVPALASAVPDELAERRGRRGAGARWWALGAAAAAGVVIGGVGVAALTSDGDAGRTVLAASDLTDLASEAPAGEAIVEERGDGQRVLVVDTTDYEDLDDAYLEVWLIDEKIEGMVSLGHLTGEHTEFTLPAGIDIAQFPIVDISVEPVDGVPTHSGDSVTRGVLGT